MTDTVDVPHLKVPLPALAAAFFFSGAAALMLEVVWSRGLHLLFGGSAVSTSAVLAAYMGGLAAGSLWLAPVVRRRWHPLVAYGVLEVGIAAYALAAPAFLAGAGRLQLLVVPVMTSGIPGTVVRFALAALVLVIPTMLMGATLPCLADLVAEGAREPRPRDQDGGPDRASQVGLLYASNTAGAVGGTLAATFLFFPALGLARTNHLAAGVDALVGVAAVVAWWRLGRPGPVTRGPARPVLSGGGDVQVLPLWVYGLTGCVAMALQVVWTRSLAMVLGSSIHAFTLMLAAFLSGLAVGAQLASSWRARDWGPLEVLGAVVALAGCAALGGTWLIDQLPGLVFEVARRPDLSIELMWGISLLSSSLVMFPAAVCFGAVLPLTLRAAMPRGARESLGDVVGRAYAINTLGAIAGSLLGGFAMGPLVGVDRGAQLASMLLGVVGAALLLRRRRAWALGALACVAVMATWDGFNVARWSSGAFRIYLARSVWDDAPPEGNVVFRRDGLSTTVTVENNEGRLALKVNGKVDASSEGDMSTQVLSGLLPSFFHANPRRAAIVGFGSGITSDALLALSSIQELEMIELEPAVVEAGELFAPFNHRPWKDPRYRGIFDDGRHHLTRPGAPYDVIISEPSNPWITGASSLFTVDFWSLARGRLAPGGIFLQWIQMYEMAPERVASLMATFASVFPHVLVFAAHPDSNDTLLLGSESALVLDEALLDARWADPAVRRQLTRGEIRSALDICALIMADRPRLEALSRGAVLNTDDNMYVELHAPRDLVEFGARDTEIPGLKDLQGKRAALVEANTIFRAQREPGELDLTLAEVMYRAGMMADAREYLAKLLGMGPELESARARLMEAMEVLEGDDELAVADEEVAASGDTRYLRAVQAMVDGQDQKALRLFEAFPGLEEEGPAYRSLYAYLLYRGNWRWRAKKAVEPLLREEDYIQDHPEVLYYAARIFWLVDENHRATEVALRYVDLRRAARAARTLEDLATEKASGVRYLGPF